MHYIFVVALGPLTRCGAKHFIGVSCTACSQVALGIPQNVCTKCIQGIIYAPRNSVAIPKEVWDKVS